MLRDVLKVRGRLFVATRPREWLCLACVCVCVCVYLCVCVCVCVLHFHESVIVCVCVCVCVRARTSVHAHNPAFATHLNVQREPGAAVTHGPALGAYEDFASVRLCVKRRASLAAAVQCRRSVGSSRLECSMVGVDKGRESVARFSGVREALLRQVFFSKALDSFAFALLLDSGRVLAQKTQFLELPRSCVVSGRAFSPRNLLPLSPRSSLQASGLARRLIHLANVFCNRVLVH